MRWTDDQDAVLRAGYGAGRLAVEIANELGRNKNQVLGRAFRLGLSSPLQGLAGNRRHRAIFGSPVSAHEQQESYFGAVKAWGKSHPFGTVMQCAADLGISKGTVTKHVKRIRASWPSTDGKAE